MGLAKNGLQTKRARGTNAAVERRSGGVTAVALQPGGRGAGRDGLDSAGRLGDMDLTGAGSLFGETVGAEARTACFNTAAGAKMEHGFDLLGP